MGTLQKDVDLSQTPVGDYFMEASYVLQAQETKTDMTDLKLAYTYSCPSMIADCETFKKKDGKYVVDDTSNKKIVEDEYACGKGDKAAKKHCCSLTPSDPAPKGSIKVCMDHTAGSSPFGKYEWKDNDKSMNFKYICPSLVQDCPNGDECSAKGKAKHCCNLQSVSPDIKGENFMCMEKPDGITGKWSLKEKDGDDKIDYDFKCPASVLQNCTNDAEKECEFKSPYCCKVKGDDYKWKKSATGQSDFTMCMDTPQKGIKKGESPKLKGDWNEPTGSAKFSYDCPDTPFDPAASSFDDFFDYAINFKFGNNEKLSKPGLNYKQCEKNSDCPKEINNNTVCCVKSTMMLGDWN